MIPAVLPFFPYQRQWVDDLSRLKIIDKARQVGITFTETWDIVQRLLASRKPQKWYYLSINEERAKEAIEYARAHLLAMGHAYSETKPQEEWVEHPLFRKIRYKQLTIHFPNGCKLIGLPANPVTARGCSGNVTLDEMAHHHDAAKIWKAVFPVTTWGYSLHIISTPNGNQGEYARIWTSNGAYRPEEMEDLARKGLRTVGDGWSRHWVDVHTAAEQGHPVDVDQCRQLAGDDETWQQEYCCQFLDEAHAWLPYDLLDRRTHPECSIYFDHTQRPAGPVWVGMDIGRKRDLSVIWLNEQRGKEQWTRGVIAMGKTAFDVQEKALWDLMPMARRACIDETGIGAMMAERAVDKWGSNAVEGIGFTGDRPGLLATKLKRALETNELWIPDDPEIRKDLHAVRRTYTDLGKVRFDAKRGKSGHADRFWAAALALSAADYGTQPLRPGDYQGAAGTGRPRLKIGRNWEGY